MRYAESYAPAGLTDVRVRPAMRYVEYGFCRDAPRETRRRPRASL